MKTAICNCPFAAQFAQHNLQLAGLFTRQTTLREDIDAYLLHMEATGRAASTIICYRGYLKRLTGLLGEIETAQITGRTLEQAVVRLQEQFPCSKVTQNKIRSAYRSLFQWLFASEQITSNPAALLHLAKTTPNRTIPITQEEVTTLLERIRISSNPLAARDELLFAMYAYTGIRRSEALQVRLDDYDWMTKTLHLRGTKGGGNRLQPVPSRLAYILEKHIERLSHDGASFLFPGADAQKPLSNRQAHTRFVRWKSMVDSRRGLTIHSFRAGFATKLYRTTGDIWLVSCALGHSGLQTIRHYVQADNIEIRGAVERAFC